MQVDQNHQQDDQQDTSTCGAAGRIGAARFEPTATEAAAAAAEGRRSLGDYEVGKFPSRI
jgi:hypothetical protein